MRRKGSGGSPGMNGSRRHLQASPPPTTNSERPRSENIPIARRASSGNVKSKRDVTDSSLNATSCPEPRRGQTPSDDGGGGGEDEPAASSLTTTWEEPKSYRKRDQRRGSSPVIATEADDSNALPKGSPLTRSDSSLSLSRSASLHSHKSDSRPTSPSFTVTTPPSSSGRKKTGGRKCPSPMMDGEGSAPKHQNDEVSEWNAEYRSRISRATPPPTSNPSMTSDLAKRAVGERWKGRLDYPNNGFYVGDLLKKAHNHVVRDGIGTAFDPVKNKIFEGSFVDDLKNGYGVTRYSDKVHQGNYQLGLRHGHGVFLFSSGDKYEGEFYRGEFHGKGRMSWKDGTVFEGVFRKGRIRKGIKRWVERGETYEGYFDERGGKTGFGITRFANGDYHRGYYLNGLPHGRGERFDRAQGTTSYLNFVRGTADYSAAFVVTRGDKTKFAGEGLASEEHGGWESSTTASTTTMFGRLEGDDDDDDDSDEEGGDVGGQGLDVEEQDRVQIQQGIFVKSSSSSFPPHLVQGSYTTARSRVTAQHFEPGPLVKEGTGATWHDVETGNARWAKLGSRGIGPLGKALFVFASGAARARLETYTEEGAMSESRNL